MAVIALGSAKGAPGVTTSALALAFAWPRPVMIIEADPSGGSILPGYLRGEVEATRSIVGAALAHRAGRLIEELPNNTMSLDTAGDITFLPGFTDPSQASRMAPVWPALAETAASLEGYGIDVIVDAGRFGSAHAPTPMLDLADVLLVVTRSSLPDASALRPRAATLREQRAQSGRSETLGLLIVGDRKPYSERDFAQTIPVPTWTHIAWDPKAAAVYSHGAERRRAFNRSSLVRSADAAAEQIVQRINERRARLATTSRSFR